MLSKLDISSGGKVERVDLADFLRSQSGVLSSCRLVGEFAVDIDECARDVFEHGLRSLWRTVQHGGNG
jgi:hypothetical protein